MWALGHTEGPDALPIGEETVIQMIVCPNCRVEMKVLGHDAGRQIPFRPQGVLRCSGCGQQYEIRNNIPRFVPQDNYADSFGFQWNRHAQTQIDAQSGMSLSHDRFFQVTGWPRHLGGQKILEAGCGAGRFTQVALETGAHVFSFDLSLAVDANLKNNGLPNNLFLCQADIYKIPFKKEAFDKVFCFGVLQHCPDPKKAFMNLVGYLKPGGEIVVDIYDLTLRALVNPKYWLRPLTRNLPPKKLYGLIERVVPRLFPVKRWVTERLPWGRYFAFFIPIAYHKGFFPQADVLTDQQLLEWSILDTFDKFAPKYDKPQTIGTVRRWLREADLKKIKVCYGPNGINAKGVKP
jgi:SAM-dependent methyltransferase